MTPVQRCPLASGSRAKAGQPGGANRGRVLAPTMPCVGEWRRPYEVNRLSQIGPVVLFLVVLCLCSNPVRPTFFVFDRSWWMQVLNPWLDAFVLWALFLCWIRARAGVYVGDAGVMVHAGRRRIVVPWQEIAYAGVAEVPKYPVIWQPGPCLGLVLVAPSGEHRRLPARLAAVNVRWGGGLPPYVVLTRKRMTQVVNRINELVPGHRPQSWPPSAGSLFSPR